MTSIKNNPLNNRQLSSFELGMELFNQSAATWIVVFISRIKGTLNEEIVRQALDIAQRRHPRLQSHLVGSLKNLRFETESTQKIPLRIVNTEQWQDVVLEELNQPIDSRQGFMRAVLVRSTTENNINYLITPIHHVIVDGLSGIRLHQELLTYMQKITAGEPINQVFCLPALPPVETLFPDSTRRFKGAVKKLSFLLKHLFKGLWFRPQTLGFEKCVPIKSRRCGFIHRQLDKTLTQQLIKRCQQNNTTVQAALCAAMLFTAAKKISVKKKIHLACGTAVNLRNRLNPTLSHENLGAVASVLLSFHTLHKNTSFWTLAREVKQQLKVGLENNDIFCLPFIFKTLVKFTLAQLSRALGMAVGVTNVGKINIPKVYGAYELEFICFAPSMVAFEGNLSATVTTFEEQMLINFMFSEPSISRETAELLTNEVVSCLAEACQREDGLSESEFSELKNF
jgi:hypothetical protein